MAKYLSAGDYHVGPYCGARIYRLSDWKMYGLFQKTGSGFSIGPIFFWKEHIS